MSTTAFPYIREVVVDLAHAFQLKACLLTDTVLAQLFTHREDVDQLNARELKSLPGDPVRFVARDSGSAELLQNGCPVHPPLRVKPSSCVHASPHFES